MIAHSSVNGTEPDLHKVLQRKSTLTASCKLSVRDIRDASALLGRLKAASNPATAYLFKSISDANKKTIAAFGSTKQDTTAVRIILANELNKRIATPKDLLALDFSLVKLRSSTSDLLAQKPTGIAEKRLARLLLEDCFPDSLNQLPAVWETPEDWLARQGGIPVVSEIREKAPNVPAWLLMEALCGSSNKDEDLLAGILPIIGDLSEKPSGGLTREQWFEQVSKIMQTRTSPQKLFDQSLEKHWGPLIIVITTTKGSQRIVNLLPYAALCAAHLGLWFDPREAAFYQYQSETGIWIFMTDVEVQRLLLEWMLEGRVPEAVASVTQAALIAKHLKVLALYEKTDLRETPVHLADQMLYLGEERRPVPFSPAYFSKNRVPITYDYSKTATNTLFLKFLERNLASDDIELLQKWCGYVLLGKNPHHKILLIRGVGGSGKSTLVDIFETIIGSENVASLNVQRLDDRFELAAFRGKTLLIGKDVASDIFKSKAAHTLKALSGDQGIEAELKFENRRFKLSGPFNIVITSNADLELDLRGDSAAWDRRLLIIDFNKPVSEKILNYAAKVVESSAEGILNWMLAGAEIVLKMERLKERLELSVPQQERKDRLINQSSSHEFFIKGCLKAQPGSSVLSAELYQSYLEFCNQQILNPIDETLFFRVILAPIFRLYQAQQSENIVPPKGRRGRGYKQIAIKPESEWPAPYRIQKDFVEIPSITEKDLLNIEGLRRKLADETNPAYRWVWQSVATPDRKNLEASHRSDDTALSADQKEKSIAQSLVGGLNKFLKDKVYYKQAHSNCAAVMLRPETAALLKMEPQVNADVRRLKRLLLEDIFPEELAKIPGRPSSDATETKSPNTDNTVQ